MFIQGLLFAQRNVIAYLFRLGGARGIVAHLSRLVVSYVRVLHFKLVRELKVILQCRYD